VDLHYVIAYCPSSLRQQVVHHGIAPQGGQQRTESIEAVSAACHRHDGRSRIEASRRRAGGSAWRASRQWALPDVTTTAGRASWHRAAGRVAERGEHEAVDTACRHYDSGSRRRRAGGSARRASRQRILPVIATTVGHASRHRATGRAAAHGGHRGSGHCLTSLRQRVAHRGIAPPGGWRSVESMRQWILPVVTTTAGRTTWHRAGAGRAAAPGEHRGSGYCLPSPRQ